MAIDGSIEIKKEPAQKLELGNGRTITVFSNKKIFPMKSIELVLSDHF